MSKQTKYTSFAKVFFGRVSIAISVVVCYKKRQVPVPILGKEMVLYRFL
ncbi:hypothetical protein [Tenacibaculum maritimum]